MASIGACGLAALASFTHPFTLGADLITAIPIVAMIVAEAAWLVRAHGSSVAAVPVAPPEKALRRLVPWIVLSGVVVGFELFNYFELPRRAHPTLSSLSDELTRWPAGTAILFLAWLALGVIWSSWSARRYS